MSAQLTTTTRKTVERERESAHRSNGDITVAGFIYAQSHVSQTCCVFAPNFCLHRRARARCCAMSLFCARKALRLRAVRAQEGWRAFPFFPFFFSVSARGRNGYTKSPRTVQKGTAWICRQSAREISHIATCVISKHVLRITHGKIYACNVRSASSRPL